MVALLVLSAWALLAGTFFAWLLRPTDALIGARNLDR
jgi:hypothetical protein